MDEDAELSRLHRGLLLGLAELRREFLTDGERFHLAYRAALDAQPSKTTSHALEEYDPVFGVYRTAEGMILEGMRDLLLRLDSRTWTRATFLVSSVRAQNELGELADQEAYRRMAAAMHARL
jgi:hypothetical protein